MGNSVIPGFGTATGQKAPQAMPQSFDCGIVDVPWNTARTVFRYRAPANMIIKNPTIFCGEIVSPSGAPVVMEAWKNGVYGGSVTLAHGANQYDRSMSLSTFDLIELRIVVKGTENVQTTVSDLWVMFTI